MLSFENDYSEGASEKILQRLIETNMEQLSGYGNYPDTDLIHTVKVQNRKSGRRANVRRQMFIS